MAVTRKGSGKTKGAGSFVVMPLSELNSILKDNAQVIVSRRFAETLSLDGNAFKATTENIKALGTQIEVTEQSLEQAIRSECEADGTYESINIQSTDLNEDEIDW